MYLILHSSWNRGGGLRHELSPIYNAQFWWSSPDSFPKFTPWSMWVSSPWISTDQHSWSKNQWSSFSTSQIMSYWMCYREHLVAQVYRALDGMTHSFHICHYIVLPICQLYWRVIYFIYQLFILVFALWCCGWLEPIPDALRGKGTEHPAPVSRANNSMLL